MYIQAVGFSVKKRQVVNIRKRQKGVVENQNHISEANHVESMGTLIQQVMYCLPNHSGQRICGKGIPGLQRAISNNEGRLTDKEQTDEESTFAQQLETKPHSVSVLVPQRLTYRNVRKPLQLPSVAFMPVVFRVREKSQVHVPQDGK